VAGGELLAQSLIGGLGEGFGFVELGLSEGALAHRLIETRETPVDLDIRGRDFFRRLKIVEGGLVVAGVGIENAEIEPGEFLRGTEFEGALNEGTGDIVAIEADIGVSPVGDALGIVGLVFDFELELAGGLVKLALAPQQVAEPEVDAGDPGIGFDSGAELADGVFMVAHFVIGFAGEHVGFSGFGIEVEDLVVDVEDARILLRPEAGVRQDQTVGKVLRVARHGLAQEGHGGGILLSAVVGRADKETETLRVG